MDFETYYRIYQFMNQTDRQNLNRIIAVYLSNVQG